MREENTGGAKKSEALHQSYTQIVKMRFRSYRPGCPLSDFVEDFWLCDGYASPHLRERIFPSGTFDPRIQSSRWGPANLPSAASRSVYPFARGGRFRAAWRLLRHR